MRWPPGTAFEIASREIMVSLGQLPVATWLKLLLKPLSPEQKSLPD
jgi:hypothetical protein